MAHISLIHGPDGAKLSKRHGALGVEAYRAMGFLPPALRNYLVRLGWSHGDQEVFSTEEMIALFDLDHVGRSAARFDFAKLENLNGQYLRAMSDEAVLAAIEGLLPHLPDGAAIGTRIKQKRDRLLAAMSALKERAKTLVELIDSANFLLVERPVQLDDKARELLTPEARATVARVLKVLEPVEPWTVENTEGIVRGFAEREGMKLGTVAQPLRAALTGRSTSPGIFDVLAVLGKAESLARLRDQTGIAAAA
jgi:glutamyl-tRNA synthetase